METHPLHTSEWTLAQKIIFRFFFIFFGLFIIPFPLNLIPGSDTLFSFYNDLWTGIVNLSGSTFFGLEEKLEVKFTGSGDSLYSWLYNFSILFLALLGCLIWSVFDRKRKHYHKLQWWFLMIVTYYLAYYLFFYGIVKVFYTQFVPPNLERMFQTFGQASPMRLLWTFMGASETYTMFSGFCEATAGLLLVFRRTRTLGGLAAVGVMLNVFLLNMSYDVPVKLFSFQLMIMGLYIAMQDGHRLFQFFVGNAPTEAGDHTMPIQKRWAKWVIIGLQVVLSLYAIIFPGIQGSNGRKSYGIDRVKSPLYGIYHVNTFIANQDTLEPLLTDTLRWKTVLFDYPNFISIIDMDDKVQRYNSAFDTLAQSLELQVRNDTTQTFFFEYEKTDSTLSLRGILKGDSLEVHTDHYSLDRMGLLNRGFHWINEVPYNRYNYD